MQSNGEWGYFQITYKIHYVLWFESLNYTSVASSTVIVCLQPLFALIGGYSIFKEKYSKLALMGCIIAILGSIVIGWGDIQISNEALLGDIMALVAAAIIAGYFMVGQQIRTTLSAIPYSVISFGSGSVFLAIYSLMRNENFINYPLKTWEDIFRISIYGYNFRTIYIYLAFKMVKCLNNIYEYTWRSSWNLYIELLYSFRKDKFTTRNRYSDNFSWA